MCDCVAYEIEIQDNRVPVVVEVENSAEAESIHLQGVLGKESREVLRAFLEVKGQEYGWMRHSQRENVFVKLLLSTGAVMELDLTGADVAVTRGARVRYEDLVEPDEVERVRAEMTERARQKSGHLIDKREAYFQELRHLHDLCAAYTIEQISAEYGQVKVQKDEIIDDVHLMKIVVRLQ